ncbi:tetratricopeptide repeat protein [bacterium]|nr:tetratricopeptide repeat protein [bacterium]
MKSLTALIVCVLAIPTLAAEPFLVRDGQPKAEIVIAEPSPRTTKLAAQELQHYVEKISGAKLPIVNSPTDTSVVRVFVGRSAHTDRLGLSIDDLKAGAYRMKSGDGWLALLGDDADFTPIEPWPRSNGDVVSGKTQAEWDQITGKHWGNPLSQLRKNYTGAVGSFGKQGHQEFADDGSVHVWGFDERGSFNAVCGFLRSLGVRWYMPGEVGEVVPKWTTIALPKIDETVRPDFPVRAFNIRFGVHGRDTSRWAMHLGIRNPYGLQTAHGLNTMTHNEYTLTHHPDWFALYGGQRHTQLGQRLNQLCYSNDELLHEAAAFARAQFDHYHFDVVSIMPPDGYTAICQCEKCQGKDDPERGARGVFSDYVWDFVNRVAKEVRRTHPDKLISNCAYGTYTLPPKSIDRLEPNVQVIIVGGRRPTADSPEQREELRKLREGWASKTDNPIMIFENYPFTDRGWYLPSFVPTTIGESINATKGMSKGEDIWLSVRQDFDQVAIGFNHFQVYFTARMYWGGPEQSVDALFDEYCRLFYGPAENEVRTFFRFCETNWHAMEQDKSQADAGLALFAAAQGKVAADSVYARRLDLIDDFLDGLRNKSTQLGKKRGPVPQVRLVGDAGEITLDGKLDEEAWTECPVSSTGRLRELQTGRQPIFGTSFKSAWRGGNLYFGIRCDEHPGEKLNIATTKDEDPATWYGDVVEVLIETEAHSYYQLAVNPSGALIDLDRGVSKDRWYEWASNAEVATHVADDHWSAEIRIPVTEDENDPLHQVVGHKPTQSLPWYFNICRQRIREHGTELSAFSPTGTAGFHVPLKFGHFYAGRSHRFEDAGPDDDFLSAFHTASELQGQRKYDEAIAAFVALAERKLTDEQKSAALEQAAASARALKDFNRAAELAGQIPIEAVSKTTQMHDLLAQRQFAELVTQFRNEDFDIWPFWQLGPSRFARAQAYAATGSGKEAESDFQTALKFTSDSQTRLAILLAMGSNRETNLKDDEAALAVYQQIVESSRNNGSATYFRGIQLTARILTRQQKFDQALSTLHAVDLEILKGYWRGSMYRVLGDTLKAAGRADEARAAYEKVLQEPGSSTADRDRARQSLGK